MTNLIGNVGGNNKVISVTPTVQAAAYATGEVIGGKMTLTGALMRPGGTGKLQSIALLSKSDLTVNMDLVLFSSDPSNTTFTENGAVAIATTDIEKVLGVFSLTTRVDVGTPVAAFLSNLNLPVQGDGTLRDLYACLIARGAYTPASTSDLIVRFGFELDQ